MSESGGGVVTVDDFPDLPWVADAPPPFDPALDALVPVPGAHAPESLSDDGRVDALVALARLRAQTEAQMLRLLAAMAPAPTSELDKEFVLDEVGCALGESPTSVRWRVAWPAS